jgi:hypothetical protein
LFYTKTTETLTVKLQEQQVYLIVCFHDYLFDQYYLSLEKDGPTVDAIA